MALIKCVECGKEISDQASACPNCGCPVFNTSSVKVDEGITGKKKSKKRIIVTIILLTILFIIVTIAIKFVQYASVVEYKQDAYDCTYEMLEGLVEAEEISNQVVAVWGNSIWQISDSGTNQFTQDSNQNFYDDFNDALSSLYADDSFSKKVNKAYSNNEDVKVRLGELSNPPKSCEDLYSALMDYYDEYYRMMQCALNPSGSYNSYSSEFADADAEALKKYDKVMIYLE